MMRSSRLRLILVIICAATSCEGPLNAGTQEFSAVIVVSGAKSIEYESATIHVSGAKSRLDSNLTDRPIFLQDAEANTFYMLMPGQNTYMESPVQNPFFGLIGNPNAACPKIVEMMRYSDIEGAWTCARLGNDTVNGRAAIEYEAVSPRNARSYLWIDPKLKSLIKNQTPQGRTAELREIREGPQAATLFQIPSGYRKIEFHQWMQERLGASPPGVSPRQ